MRDNLKTLATDDERREWLNYSYHFLGHCVYIMDEGKMFNHSETNYNVHSEEQGDCFASRDIQENEELLENYSTFEHPRWYYDLCDEYSSPHHYYDKTMVDHGQ